MLTPEEMRHESGVGPMVVISKTGVDAVSGSQLGENGGHRSYVLALVRNVVASKQDEIRL